MAARPPPGTLSGPHEGPRRAQAPRRAAARRLSRAPRSPFSRSPAARWSSRRASFERPGGPFEALKATGLFTSRSKGWIWVPCPAFLITHPSAGSILVDTSLHSSIAAEPRENFGRLAARLARPRIESGKDLPSQLRERGADPRSIPFVVMTHLHMDHASGISEFPSSTFVALERRMEGGHRPGRGRSCAATGRSTTTTRSTTGWSTSTGRRVDSYSTFGRTFDLFGDGSIRLAFTPGHTVGHMCVLARLEDRDFVIAGDAVYTMRQLEGGPGAAAPAGPSPLAPLAAGAAAVPPGVPAGRDRRRATTPSMGDARRQVRVSAAAAASPLAVRPGGDPASAGAPIPSRRDLITPLRPFSSSAWYISRTRSKISPATSSWRSRSAAGTASNAHRLAELDRHLRESAAFASGAPPRAVDRDRDDRHARLERDPADPRLSARRARRCASGRPRRRSAGIRRGRGSRRRS